ncbi:MAG: hypothetical protein OEW60_06425 [Thiovulaceae bacterium]|nr:hypothetical protein [Sulfurimonadaceae bacterium]
MSTRRNPLTLIIENSVILTLADYKMRNSEFKIALTILNQSRWYKTLKLSDEKLKAYIKKYISELQAMSTIALQEQFKANTLRIQTDVPSRHYEGYTDLLQALVDISESETIDHTLFQYHKSVFSFIDVKTTSPMLSLSFEKYMSYIEGLMIYAAVDNQDFDLHENEAMLILNEIKSYVHYKPKTDIQPSDLFFRILNNARKTSKNHISFRFEGIVKSNLKMMTDEQDKYFLDKLSELRGADGVHSTQEKLFDAIIETSQKKAESHEKKERLALDMLRQIETSHIPFAAHPTMEIKFHDAMPKDPIQALVYGWNLVEKAFLEKYHEWHVLGMNKKNFYFLMMKKELNEAQYELLVKINQFDDIAQFINWDAVSNKKMLDIMAKIFVFFRNRS